MPKRARSEEKPLTEREERYACGLAGGASQVDAYVAAGYSAASARQNASKLALRPHVAARIRQLMAEALEAAKKAAAERATGKLLTAIERREVCAEIVGKWRDPEVAPDEKPGIGSVLKALVVDAKLAGDMPALEDGEVEIRISKFRGMTKEERLRAIGERGSEAAGGE